MAKHDYWLHGDSKEVACYLSEYHSKWSLWNNSPFKMTWLRNFIAYYSPAINPSSWDTSLIFEGVQGELTRMYTPKARALIRQLVTLVTKQRLAFQAMAETTGTEVIQDVKLGNALFDQIIQTERLDIKAEVITEGSLVCGKWFTKTIWRTDRGQPRMRGENGELIYSGSVEISTPGVFDVYYDISYPDWQAVPWVEVRTMKNRYDLIAQHPDMADQILGLPCISEERGPNTWFERTLIDDDVVYVYEFYSRPSPAMPKGRMMMYSNDKCIYYDNDNIYETLPVEPMTPEGVLTTGLGYPIFTNLLPCQEMFDNSISAIATNQAQFAVQSVAIARGANVNVQELNGMRFVSFTPQNVPGGGKPEPLQLSQSSPETFKFADYLDAKLVDLSGINNALRGNPPPGVTSGVALATLSANAMEFLRAVEKPLQLCLERTMEHALNAFKKFASFDQNLTMHGLNNQISNRSFNKKHLQNITGVKILTSNPLMNTISGRLEIAEKLLAMPKEMWPKYVSILEGRPLQDLTKADLSQEDLIHGENEELIKGNAVPVLATDDHAAHVVEHAGLLNDPAIRMNGSSIQVILDHMEEHKNLAQTTDPILTAMIRTGRMPEGAQQPPPPGPNQAPPNLGGPIGEPVQQAAAPAKDALGRGPM